MTTQIAFIKQGDNINIFLNGKTHTVSKDTHMFYNEIVDALKSKDYDSLPSYLSPAKHIVEATEGNTTFVDGQLFWKGEPIKNAITDRIVEMMRGGFSIEPMIALMNNLMMNPSKRSVDQLYTFLEKNNLPITEDGHFLAFKRVRPNYTDKHTGTMSNKVGDIVSMERNAVDDEPSRTCSSGLHFCSESYLGHFGSESDPVMILKINPADVVSIPADYNDAKGRCCKFEIIAELKQDAATVFSAPVYNATQSVLAVSTKQKAKPIEKITLKTKSQKTTWRVQRMYGGAVVARGLSYEAAIALINKHDRQKKAVLAMYPE